MRWCRRIPRIRFISTASSWRKGTPACCPCRTPATFLNRLEDLYRTSARKPQDDPDLVPAQPDHAVRGSGFHAARSCGWRAHHGTMVVHDFAYADLGFDGYKPPSILQVEAPRRSRSRFSRCRRATTWPAGASGFCLGNPKMIAALARIKSYLDYGVFQPIQIASIIALRECEEDTRKICATVPEAPRRAGRRA